MERNMALLDYIFPQDIKCIFCGKETADFAICEDCYKELPVISGKTCVKCGGRVSGNIDLCIDCKSIGRDFEKGFVIFDYVDDIQDKILKFKNGGYRNIGRAFAHIMLEKFKTLDIAFDEIIPVPIHTNRRKQRGFNQSEILCLEIKKYYGRVHPELLDRVLDTPHQASLGRVDRLNNLERAFKTNYKRRIKGKTILLVDDIYTTGTTINECAKVLYKAGADKVYSLCLSRAPRLAEDFVE